MRGRVHTREFKLEVCRQVVPDQLATAIIATVQGLQQHRFLDRASVPEELAGWAVQALLSVAMEQRT